MHNQRIHQNRRHQLPSSCFFSEMKATFFLISPLEVQVVRLSQDLLVVHNNNIIGTFANCTKLF